MLGTVKKNGDVIITYNMQTDALLAPDRVNVDGSRTEQHWIPCEQCGSLESVDLDVVATICCECYEAELEVELEAPNYYAETTNLTDKGSK